MPHCNDKTVAHNTDTSKGRVENLDFHLHHTVVGHPTPLLGVVSKSQQGAGTFIMDSNEAPTPTHGVSNDHMET